MGSVILNSQFTNVDIESLNVQDSPNVTQLPNGRAGIQTQSTWLPPGQFPQ